MKKIFIIIAVAIICLTTACKRDHLYYSYGKVANLEINVNSSTAISSNIELELNGVSAYVFNSSTGESIGDPIISSDPSKIILRLPVGIYDVVVVNDTEYELNNIDFKGTDNLSTFSAEITYNEVSKYSVFESRSNDNNYVTECDQLVYGLISDITIEDSDVAYYEEQPTPNNISITKSFDVDLHHATEFIDIEVEVKNLTSALSPPRSQLTNMSAGHLFGSATKLDNLVTHEFILNDRIFDTDEPSTGTIRKQMILFGPLSSTRSDYTNSHNLVMSFILNNGETHLVDLPVNDIMTTSRDDVRTHHAIQAAVTLPEAIGGDGEGVFDPDIEEWNDVSVDLPI